MEISESKSLEYFEMISKLVDRLDAFILQMINYYKTHHDDRINHPIDFSALIGNLIEGFRLQPEGKKILFDVHIKQDEPFVSNAIKIQIVLNNLITNAIKYMKPNAQNQTISINIVVSDFQASISVKDNGIGIQKDQLSGIFNMFVRGTGMSIGSGLGLYIVKETIERLNGSIDVQSEFGEGTEFRVILPSVIE
jgi:signal transduction histidine kinase